MENELYNSEIPKYRKKKYKKHEQKSNHKHDYKRTAILRETQVYSIKDREEHYWITILTVCPVCGRKRNEYLSVNKEELRKIKEEINMGEYPNG